MTQCNTTQHDTMQYNTMQYNIMQYSLQASAGTPGQCVVQQVGGSWPGKLEGPVGGLQGGGGVAYLFGLHRGRAAVPTVIVAEGSVVDGITVIVSHEGLYRRREAGRKGTVSIPEGVGGGLCNHSAVSHLTNPYLASDPNTPLDKSTFIHLERVLSSQVFPS